jgi:hypothetical protein
MPCVSVRLIDRLIQAFEESARAPLAVVPVRAGLRGNPALIGRDLFDAIKRLEGDRGARPLLEAAGNDVHERLVYDEAIEIDIDARRCPPVARIAAELARPGFDDHVLNCFTIRPFLNCFERHSRTVKAGIAKAIAIMAEMIGTLILARAVGVLLTRRRHGEGATAM